MSLFSRLINFTKQLTKSRLPTRQLIAMLGRVRFYLPELDEETALIVAAKLYTESQLTTRKLPTVDLVIAYQLGTFGYCGVRVDHMKRHDQTLEQDRTSKLLRWVMQMEFLVLSAELRLASPALIADIVIQSKTAIRADIDQALNEDPANDPNRDRYDRLVQRFAQGPTHRVVLEDIYYAIEQVQGDTDRNRQ